MDAFLNKVLGHPVPVMQTEHLSTDGTYVREILLSVNISAGVTRVRGWGRGRGGLRRQLLFCFDNRWGRAGAGLLLHLLDNVGLEQHLLEGGEWEMWRIETLLDGHWCQVLWTWFRFRGSSGEI